ncbi:protein serine/threonine kinase [Gracilaria domingensis]|nr:protein serine/threonine kinase [Gracilaria domingensis]
MQCEPGKYLPFSGSQSAGRCRNCPAGTFSHAGSESCTPCSNGTYSSERSSECVSCPLGTFITFRWGEQDTNPCEPCRAGYSDEENLLECKLCPPGSAAPPGATSIDQCSPCPAGTDTNGYNPCLPCQPGTFSAAASTECTPCQAGSKPEKPFGSTRCVPCDPGQYGRIVQGYSVHPQCYDCPANTTSYEHGSRFCRQVNGPCPQGFIQTSAGDCERCNTDERYDMEKERCVPCSRSEGSVGGLTLHCAPCAEVIRAGVQNSHCMRGVHPDLDTLAVNGSCAPGTHIRETEFARFCSLCGAGHFSSESDAAECIRCPIGTVSTDHGATSCELCPEGMVPDESRQECLDEETNCAIGTQLVSSGNRSFCLRNECWISEDGVSQCPPCTGSYYGSFSFEGCDECAGNEVRDVDFSCGCRGRLAANLGIVNGTCSPCAAGSYGKAVSGEAGNECVQCAAGTFRVVATYESLLSSMCPRCSTPRPCKKCAAGFVSRQAGATECEKCGAGTFSYGSGDTTCLRYGDATGPVSFNDPLDMSVERDIARYRFWWDESQ